MTRRGDQAEGPRQRKRKQQDDGRQLFIAAKAMIRRLARAAGWTRLFFGERATHAAPSQDMHLDPRYAGWYAVNLNSGSAISDNYNQSNASGPADFPSLNL